MVHADQLAAKVPTHVVAADVVRARIEGGRLYDWVLADADDGLSC